MTNQIKNAVQPDEVLDASDMADGPSDEQLKKVRDISREQVQLKRDIAILNEQLDKLSKRLLHNMQVSLPEAMAACSMESFELTGGYSVEIDRIVKASIPSPDNKKVEDARQKHEAGIAYMDKMAPDLVSNKIEINYPKGEEKLFRKFMADLKKRKIPVDFKQSRSVNSQTLSKWVRERLKKAEEVDEKALNVHRVTIAEVIEPQKEDTLGGPRKKK